MSNFLQVVPALTVIAAGIAFYILIVLAMRDRRMPAWVHYEATAQTVALVMTVGLIVGFAYSTHVLLAMGIHIAIAFLLTIMAIAIVSLVFCAAFHVRQRLRLAEQGLSPFASLRAQPRFPVHGVGAA